MTPDDAVGLALDLARQPGLEMPIAAVVVAPDGRVIGQGVNRRESDSDPTAHAEILALREAGRVLGDWRLSGCTLAVTLEPCTMCAGAISFARIRRLYYAASDPKGGAVDSGVRFFASPTCHHVPEIYPSVGETEAATLLTNFFKARR